MDRHRKRAQLARPELSILFEELLTRFDKTELANPTTAVPRRGGHFVLGVGSLHSIHQLGD